MKRVLGLALLLLLLAVPSRGQAVHQWVPAFCDIHGAIPGGDVRTYVFVGVPGERMTIRITPKKPATGTGWVAELLQGDAGTQAFVAGPSGAIDVKEVQFDGTGPVALRLSASDDAGGAWVLRARSKLPLGYDHPPVTFVPGETPRAQVATWLRPGLGLTVKVRLPHDAPGFPGGEPHVVHTPPALVGPPYEWYASKAPWPKDGKPYPDVLKLLDPESPAYARFELVSIDVPADEVQVIGTRLRREKLVWGVPYDYMLQKTLMMPVYPSVVVDLDQTDLHAGQSAHVTFSFHTPSFQMCPDLPWTAKLWLSTAHEVQAETIGGTLLAGPLPVELTPDTTTIETDVQVPADASPGLRGLWVVVEQKGSGAPPLCDQYQSLRSGAAVIRVLSP